MRKTVKIIAVLAMLSMLTIHVTANESVDTYSETLSDVSADLMSDSSGAADYNYEYGIKSIKIENQDGTAVNTLRNGALISTVTIVKNADAFTPVIFAGLYNAGKLKSVKRVPISQEQATETAVKYELNIPLSEIDENSSLKVMVWDGSTLKPYALSLKARSSYAINVDTVINQIYTFPVTVSDESRTFKVEFDSDAFSIDNLCKASDEKILTVGNATDKIRIDAIESDSFTFTYTSESVDECINCFSLKALKTGSASISIYEINN